ncbi:MAG: DUF1329 domain-containing protein [Albidovulum sp.]|nr:DUF1329 domain-containing protein [Albidovulum sp.]MDE0307986.1 DUF1329 domain-containing protein [Albidovulum sp.]MDE0533309.1 DUF1329 domain-containing protein [Albidovulum sp.]
MNILENAKTFAIRIGAALALGGAVATAASAELSADQIARLGNDLTPLGGVRAGNSSGTIPDWTGGITRPPRGYRIGEHHRDPYAGDKPLFVISPANVDRYRNRLSVGHQRMLETYPSFRMPVYPTRRSASAPNRIYDATRRIAANARLVDGGNGVGNAVIGIPFPIPKNGLEVIWNHLLRYRGESVACTLGQAAVTRGGNYNLVKQSLEIELRYSLPNMTTERLGNTMILYKQKTLSPARLAGDIVLVHETINQVRQPRNAWTYNPGQRRVRRAPNLAYDNPGTSSDGLRTSDQVDMFNGAVDRYDWKLVGKREMYVPYNSYRLHSDRLSFSDILKPLHVNPNHLRYELHRVWVVEATLKKGSQHIYKRRTFYVDEDSWQILVADIYDNRDQLWRVSEGHVVNYYEKPLIWPTLEVHTDLQAGRYFAFGLDNEFPMCTWDTKLKSRDFTPAALRREGRR